MGERILVVDDEATVRLIIKKVLQDEGHEVVEVTSGEAALDAYRREQFALVITDVLMDKMSGLDLLNEIKALDQEALVVIMTSQTSFETATARFANAARRTPRLPRTFSKCSWSVV